MALQHLRSSTANKRPTPGAMSDGQLALNTNLASPGLFFKDSNGDSVKIGPVHVGTTAPNVTPGAGGQAGNSKGEAWLDTTAANPILKVWNGSAFVAVQPVGAGTVVSTADTGTVTSTMILDGTILNADINASAAIVDTKLATIATGGKVSGTAITNGNISTSGSFTSTSTVTGTNLIPTGSGVPTNGIYLPAANSVAVATNGVGRLFINSTGLVGVGTSAPSNLLTLNAPNANALTLFVGVDTGEYSSIRGKYGAGNDFAQSEIRFINADNPNGRGALAFAVGTNSTTEHMRITYDGKVGIGDSAPDALLVIKGNSDANTTPSIRLKDGTDTREAWITNSAGDLALNVGGDDNVPHGTLKLFEGGTLTYAQGAGERLRIDSSGRLLVGTSTASSAGTYAQYCPIKIQGNSSSSTGTGCLNIARGVAAASITSGSGIGTISFSDSSGNEFAWIACEADANAGASDYPGRLVFSTTADGAASPGERMRITSDGNVLVGKTSSSFGTGDGTVIGGAGYLAQTRTSATPFTVIRNGTDGTLVSFEAQNVEEGTISVSGTTVSYNGAHLSRWSQILGIDPYNKAVRPEILRGTVMSNLDEMCDWTCPTSGDCQDNEQLNKTKISDVEGDKNVAGIFQSWDDDDDTWVNDYYLAMTGDFVIRIAAGTTVERGDLLMSAGNGTAKPQADDLVRSCTVAKVTSTTVSCTHPDGSYCVPCVLMAC
jgi:hypothetical protein